MRYELTERERAAIKPRRPNKPRGVPPVNDRRVVSCEGFRMPALHGARGDDRRGAGPASETLHTSGLGSLEASHDCPSRNLGRRFRTINNRSRHVLPTA
jgi:hypothetical protein